MQFCLKEKKGWLIFLFRNNVVQFPGIENEIKTSAYVASLLILFKLFSTSCTSCHTITFLKGVFFTHDIGIYE